MSKPQQSIRRRLLIWQMTALAVTAIVAGLVTFQLTWKAFGNIRDRNLKQIALSIARHGTFDVAVEPSDRPLPDAGEFVSQIWRSNGELAYSSLSDIGPPLQPPGIHDVHWRNEDWWVYSLPKGSESVQVAIAHKERLADFANLLPPLIVPFGLVIVLGLLIHMAVVRALKPLDSMREEISALEVHQLSPLDVSGLPEEVLPVGEAFNELMLKLDHTIRSQRQFIADAAHELNTPLAAVKVHAQLAKRSEDSALRQEALQQLDKGIDRASHLCRQLLQLARLEPDVRRPHVEAVDLVPMAMSLVGEFSSRADQVGVDLGVDAEVPLLEVQGCRPDLRVLLENLIDNALRYAPRNTAIDVQLRRNDHQVAELCVIDHGPGIAQHERERVLQRFARLNPDEPNGSGLGLAIVASVVEQTGAALSLEDTPGGGLTVRVRFLAG